VFYDATNNRLAIGTTNPTATLEVRGGQIVLNTISANSSAVIFRINDVTKGYIGPAGILGGSDNDMGYRVEGGNNHAFYIGASERARLDSSGRLGLGTSTPQSLLSVQVTSARQLNVIKDAGDDNLVLTSSSPEASYNLRPIELAGNKVAFSTGASTGTSYTERMVITDTGAVGIGTTAPSQPLHIATGSASAFILQTNGTATTFLGPDSSNTGLFGTTTNHATRFITNDTERARIDTSGRLLVGTSTALGPSTTSTGITLYPNDYSVFSSAGNEAITINRNNDGAIVSCRRSGVSVGSISVTTVATAFNTSSDYRLKENLVPLAGAIDRLQQIPVHRFNFIADPDKTVDGFLAHEAQEIVPECVTGEKDAVDDEGNPVYQGIDQSKLVPLLTAALQEAIAEIASLKDRVAALEAQ
jgi:hypothetical protein